MCGWDGFRSRGGGGEERNRGKKKGGREDGKFEEMRKKRLGDS